ncbi:hypothetical protein ACF1B0_34020 [Streptomyces anandii]|uniref:hypothetical protein n=1 Tax=Streptomyces anandii TaxID=285454 RepID=UPI003700615E
MCCTSLANAASDSDRVVDTAERARDAELLGSTSAPPFGGHRHGPGFCCGPHHKVEAGRSARHR